MKKYLLILILVFSCSVARGHGKERNDILYDTLTTLTQDNVNRDLITVDALVELSAQIDQFKARIAKLEKKQEYNYISLHRFQKMICAATEGNVGGDVDDAYIKKLYDLINGITITSE